MNIGHWAIDSFVNFDDCVVCETSNTVVKNESFNWPILCVCDEPFQEQGHEPQSYQGVSIEVRTDHLDVEHPCFVV